MGVGVWGVGEGGGGMTGHAPHPSAPVNYPGEGGGGVVCDIMMKMKVRCGDGQLKM